MTKRLPILIMLMGCIVVTLCGCSVPGDIGDCETFFNTSLILKDYVLDEETEEYGEAACDHTGSDLTDLQYDTMDFCSYSSVGLALKPAQNRLAEITTLTFELEFEAACDFNLTFYTDGEQQYESGLRSYSAGATYSFIISELAYSDTTSNFYFCNEPDAERAEDPYDGYSARWKIKYLQIIYQGR